MADSLDDQQITVSSAALRAMRDEFQRFLMEYRFGLAEVDTKIAMLWTTSVRLQLQGSTQSESSS